jgi:hypothetical protein
MYRNRYDLRVAANLSPGPRQPRAGAADGAADNSHDRPLPGRGRIACGLRADLLLVDGDLCTDITATHDIAAA